uniref:EGF-like domain-containing protein n=1 Tax=Pseudo-nitzschia australis TaxID=44445 RepID=A0A7S4AXA5_9STRA
MEKIMSFCRWQLFPILFVTVAAAATRAAATSTEEVPAAAFWVFTDCELECANGGYCRFLRGTADDLSRLAQAGILVETCRCPPRFTGTTCQYTVYGAGVVTSSAKDKVDAAVEVPPERRCHSGIHHETKTRTKRNTTTTTIATTGTKFPGCDCALADSVSEFAGRMCRKPVTEYCAGKFDIHDQSDRSFCTNGGRCRGDVLGATFLLEDLESNNNDNDNSSSNAINGSAAMINNDSDNSNSGCLCPSDFYGPHCEFLRTRAGDENMIVNVVHDDEKGRLGKKDAASPSSLRPQVDYETNEKKSSSGSDSSRTHTDSAFLLILIGSILVGSVALSVYVNRVVHAEHSTGYNNRTRSRRRFGRTKTKTLMREWNQETKTRNSKNSSSSTNNFADGIAVRYLAWGGRKSTAKDNDTVLSRTWDDRSETSSNDSSTNKAYHDRYSYRDDESEIFEQVNFNEGDIDEGIIKPIKEIELETIHEETENTSTY